MGGFLRAAGLAALGVSGCAILVDTEDLAGGPDTKQESPTSVDGSGAPGSDGGTADERGGGTSDAARDGPLPPPSCPSNALLCDGFEDGNFQRWSRTFEYPTGQQSFDTRNVHSGALSLHTVVGDAENPTGVGVSYDLPRPLSAGTFAARAYVYSAEVPKVWTDLMRLARDGTFMSMGIAAPHWRAHTWDLVLTYSRETFEPGVWHSVEWVVEVGSPGRQTVYVDEAPVIDEVKDTAPSGFAGWSEFLFGIVFNEGDKGADIYFDDVAIGTSRIGCR